MVHFIYKHRSNTFATETHMQRSTSKTITRAIGYSRVSTDDQILSVDAQRARLERWCAERHMELVAVHEEIGISGGADLDKRPALIAALDALEPGMALIAVKRDRIARDAMNAAMIERLAERAGAQVLTCDGAGEGDSPEAKLMRTMIDAFAEYERAIIRARTKVAMGHKRHRDERISGHIPFGKALAPDGIHLVDDPAEQLVIAAAHTYRASGLSLRAVAARLETEGYSSRTGKVFTAQAIANMIEEVA
jgi:site-specific DNA recombinase